MNNKTKQKIDLLNYLKLFFFSGGVVLNALLNTLPPSHVRSRVQQYITMINECDEQYFPKVRKRKLKILFYLFY